MTMPTHDCDAFRERLITALDGNALASDVLDGAHACAECSQVLRDLMSAITPPVDLEPSPTSAERAIVVGSRWARRVFVVGKTINVAISITIVLGWFAFVELRYAPHIGFRLPTGGLASLITEAFIVIALGTFALRGHVRNGRREYLYSRWDRRQLQGICTGIAEYFRVPLWLVRLGFIALFVSGLGGGTIYFLLAFLISFHPDDRRHLHWFKIQRWWRRRGLAAA
jgi:phage shock protein PspC (stress-responsive transcriptional regulator)